MYEYDTGGQRRYTIPDMCPYCQLDSAGNHQPDCPLYGEEIMLTNNTKIRIVDVNKE